MAADDRMYIRNLLDFFRTRVAPYTPDPGKEAQMRAALDLLRTNTETIVAAGRGIQEAKDRADIRHALASVGKAVRR